MQPAPTHAVKAIITNDAGDVLFLQRNAAARVDMRSNWDLPGGLIEPGENHQAALTREIMEELGVNVASIGSSTGEWSFYRPYDGATVSVTNYPVVIVETSFTLSDEHVGYKWIPRSELQEREIDMKDASLFNALG